MTGSRDDEVIVFEQEFALGSRSFVYPSARSISGDVSASIAWRRTSGSAAFIGGPGINKQWCEQRRLVVRRGDAEGATVARRIKSRRLHRPGNQPHRFGLGSPKGKRPLSWYDAARRADEQLIAENIA